MPLNNKTPYRLRYKLNPCDIDRYPVLAPLGDLLAHLASECPCCNTLRVVVAIPVSIIIGFFIGALT